MSPERLILAAGGILVLVLLGGGLIPVSFLGRDTADARMSLARQGPASSSEVGVQTGNPYGWGRKSAPLGMAPFSRAKSERFLGTVTRVKVRGENTGWSQVHIWVDNGSGTVREVSIAPKWFLGFTGCKVKGNSRVRGAGFKFDRVQSNAVLYAKNIKIGDKSCRLRNNEGFALWSNKLR